MNTYKKYLEWHNDTPIREKSSVHKNRSTVRFEKAEEQAKLETVDTETITGYVNEFLEMLNINLVKNPKVLLEDENIDYDKIKNNHCLKSEKDIVWLKFTTDGFVGVVATSNDVNFDIPNTEEDYDLEVNGNWKHTTSGIIIHNLRKQWDESFVLVFPLENIPNELTRGDVERGIGNYLIDKGVPILDFYSHNY